MFNVGASEKGIRINYEVTDDFPSTLLVDEQRIKQIVLNLLQNALKFTFEGSITLKASYNTYSQELKVCIADTGVGVKQEDRV